MRCETEFSASCESLLVSFDVDLFIVAFFLWPRYKSMAMSKRYDYNAIRQGILRLANILKCFVIDQAYQLVHEIEKYHTGSYPFSFTEEQLDLNAREVWDLFPDKTNVLCIIARKLFAIAPTSISGSDLMHRYNELLPRYHYNEVLTERMLFLSSLHQSQLLEKQKLSYITATSPPSALSSAGLPRSTGAEGLPMHSPSEQYLHQTSSVHSNSLYPGR